MNLKFQYNKTSLQNLDKQLKIRLRAMPTLKNKESALRMEVKNARKLNEELGKKLEQTIRGEENNLRMWNEFDDSLLKIRDIKLSYRKIAGVKIPEPGEIMFSVRDYDLFNSPKWYPDGLERLKELIRLTVEKQLMEKKYALLEYARKKTTQKVNLYEKVQIPAYENAIRRIKRYLEDEDNLARAAQKIVKTRKQKTVEAGL
ncbi:MAG: V-type ATP synthase subunit D [Bacteroidales bacterium]|jgi:V/A-type H+-transporting ATPase subunit D|nr:V-type ATP synthase subunit D [Bacteroidales bacterium]